MCTGVVNSNLLYKMRVFIDFSATNKSDNLACPIISLTQHCDLMLFFQSDGAIFNFFI